ncbi:MAG: hypothetical protein M1829_000642 [Trizodia sp. TS-e1964]|nr:MAG: hypothetical protein M1829_000642 [Trizodia sp. TS-e1964]
MPPPSSFEALSHDYSASNGQGQKSRDNAQAIHNTTLAWKKESSATPEKSFLRMPPQGSLHDVVCVGFGPASLAIAIALQDLVGMHTVPENLSHLLLYPPSIVFLERQCHFAWHAGMLLPGAKMQISFIKDLATLRNPKSEFTFLNYLHRHGRLVQYSNLGTFLPLRLEYEDYMRWCSVWFEDVVEYGKEVIDIGFEEKSQKSPGLSCFLVSYRDKRTGESTVRKAKNVVIAVGGKPAMPKCLPQDHQRIIHSSNYSTVVPGLLKDTKKPYRIAVIGSGQSAAEIFHDLHSRYPNAKTSLLINGSALRQSDDSPFVNEIFDPDRVDRVYQQSDEVRAAAILQDRGTNYGVVRLELLEQIYADLYSQRIKCNDESQWQHRILPFCEVENIEDVFSPDSAPALRLHIRNTSYNQKRNQLNQLNQVMDADILLVATGYVRNAHEDLLQHVHFLMPEGGRTGETWKVDRNYRVKMNRQMVPQELGIWLQGCNEKSHGKDEVRTKSYRDAICQNKHLFKDKIVLDVGCGTSILSMFETPSVPLLNTGIPSLMISVQNTGVDMSTIIEKAREIVKINGMEDKITLIQGKMEEVELPFAKVDIIISEWMGYFLLYESMLDTVIYARDKYLVPGGLIFPDKATIFMAGIEDGDYKEEKIDFWNNVYGFDYSPLKQSALTEPLVDTVEMKAVVTDPTPVLILDLHKVKASDLNFSSAFILDVRRNDFIHALIAWFDIDFTACHKPIHFSTGPHARYTHWKQTVFYLSDVLTVEKEEQIHVFLQNKPNDKNKRDLDIKISYDVDSQNQKRRISGSSDYKM